MPEQENPAVAVIIDYACDRCGERMRCLDMLLTSMPPLWRHVCDHCSAQNDLPQRYPATVFRREAEQEDHMAEKIAAAVVRKMPAEGKEALREIVGCFDAASTEGLYTVLAETQDERLKDLVERRLLGAYNAAMRALFEKADRTT